MTKQEFLEDFEIFVINDILENFKLNEYISFSIDFKSKLDKYIRLKILDITEVQNFYLVDILVNSLELKIFEDNFEMINKLENFNSDIHKLNTKYFEMIDKLKDTNLNFKEAKNMIIEKTKWIS